MKFKDATALANKVPTELGVVESILMTSPPDDTDSYVVQVRTKTKNPTVFWLGPEKMTLAEIKELLTSA